MSCVFEFDDVAERYDKARSLPEETLALWMNALKELVPVDSVNSILDLGAGTGRFATYLRDTFLCPVVAVDPSEAMLRQGQGRQPYDIQWLAGTAENIPLVDKSVNLVWMSQVFHHFTNPAAVIKEVRRVLMPGGSLAVRNSTRESEAGIKLSYFFPEIPDISVPREDIITVVCGFGFETVKIQTVPQVFASSYTEYYEKISHRGLSPLLLISDEAFANGMEMLKQWITTQSVDQPIVEPLDLLVFKMPERI